jgi:hypothetical protein
MFFIERILFGFDGIPQGLEEATQEKFAATTRHD